MKMIIQGLLALIMTAGLVLPAYAGEAPGVSARAALLMEADSGDVLYESNADEPMLIASTTKILTALVAMERCDLDQVVVIDPAWTGIEGSSMYLAPGQELTVEDLLYGLMLASGNDAAVALACIAAGSVEDFAVLMNEKAETLGCESAHFVNPNGLDAEGHHASARDLAIITREAIQNETFCKIASTQSKTIGDMTYTNHNRLLRECEGVFGVKTGYTEAAGRSLVTCCERNGVTLICVTLSAPDDWNDHKSLYDWAYSRWTAFTVLEESDARTVPVIGGRTEEVSVAPATELSVCCETDDAVTLTMELPAFVYAPVAAGAAAGRATAWIDGEKAGSVELVFQESIEKTEEEKPSWPEWLRGLF